MNFTFLFISLFGISLATNLTVEGIKKLLDTKNTNYSSNLIAVIVSVILSVVSVVLYCVYFSVSATPQIVVETIVLTYLSFLVATNGYDKVIQCIKQIKEKTK